MPYIIIVGLLLPLVTFSQEKNGDKVVDSFLTSQFDFLENQIEFYSKANIDSIDTMTKDFQADLDKEKRSIELFEKLTGIKAEIFHSHVYAKVLKQTTVDSWKSWINKNRRLVIWDNARGTVNRSDRDIWKK
jgi:hypothetical protein